MELTCRSQVVSASPASGSMQRVIKFYENLPRGPAPAEKPKGLLGRYQARYFSGEKASAARMSPAVLLRLATY